MLWRPDDAQLTLDAEVAIVEVGWGAPKSVAHIPGASYLDTNELEREHDAWKLLPPRELILYLERLGISAGTRVRLYSDSPLAAARAAFAMLYAGVADVRVLDGGFQAYLASGRAVVAGERAVREPRAFGAVLPLAPSLLVSRAEVEAFLGDPSVVLADVRSLDELEGRTSGYLYIEHRGCIPGATWAMGGPHANYVEEYTSADGVFHDSARVLAMWRSRGIEPSKPIVFYCGTSWRASLAFLFAWDAGFPKIAVYDGGWLEWSARRAPRTPEPEPANAGANWACRSLNS